MSEAAQWLLIDPWKLSTGSIERRKARRRAGRRRSRKLQRCRRELQADHQEQARGKERRSSDAFDAGSWTWHVAVAAGRSLDAPKRSGTEAAVGTFGNRAVNASARIAEIRQDIHAARWQPSPAQPLTSVHPAGPIGLIMNGKAHRNRFGFEAGRLPDHVSMAAPASQAELDGSLREWSRLGVRNLIVSGGDGTIRDVISTAVRHFIRMPTMAIVPAGKTNALAADLGVPRAWTVADAVDAVERRRIVERCPLVVDRPHTRASSLYGFLMGAGAFVRATELAQQTHRWGAYDGLAVGLALTGGVARSVFGTDAGPWRAGEPMRIVLADGTRREGPMYIMLASTLERLPLRIRPFGGLRRGLRMLTAAGPPRQLALTMPAVLAGAEGRWLSARGIWRSRPGAMHLTLSAPFVLDGEAYPGGELLIRQGRPVEFVVP